MSSRQLRKVFGTGPSIPKFEDSSSSGSDIAISHKDIINPFAELEVSSATEHETDTSPFATPTSKKPKKKVKKNKKRSNKPENKAEPDEDIDRILQKINKVFGLPSTDNLPEKIPEVEHFEKIFAVYKKHLNSTAELERRFGPDDEDGGQRVKKNQPKEYLSDRITPVEGYVRTNGILMSRSHIKEGLHYYIYDHSYDYQRRHRNFLESDIFTLRAVMLEDPTLNTAEAEIEKIALLFKMEEYTMATKALEYLIARLQCAADPRFSLSNRKCRLQYRVVENRPFHIAVLQYSHVLSNKGCHRTALELAKALLNLDRSDPLAVELIIDTYAIRACEYEWLVRAVDWYEREREGKYLFNLQYSKALAMFHIAVKNNDSLDAADEQLKKALMLSPFTLDSIVRDGGARPNARIQKVLDDDFFKTEIAGTNQLHQLTKLYAAFLSTWWREPPVYEWLVRNAEELLPLLQSSASHQECAEHMKAMRLGNLRCWPAEVYRHISVIMPLSQFIVEGAVPPVHFYGLMYRFNPLRYQNSINRYQYNELPDVPEGAFI